MNQEQALPLKYLAGRRATWIETDLEALAGNLRAILEVCERRPVWAVVKADAYGHGAVACARTLAEAGAYGVVVALPEEGLALRRAGLDLPILMTGSLPVSGVDLMVCHDIAPAISSLEQLHTLAAAASAAGRRATFHLEIDTGMTRLGVRPEDLEALLPAMREIRSCRLASVMSHLASVSRPADSRGQAQLRLFRQCVAQIRETLGEPIPAHLASSPAICSHPDAFFDMVRPGLLLYGVCPDPLLAPPFHLRPVLSFRTTVLHLRQVPGGTPVGYNGLGRTSGPAHVAVIGAGYGDGLRRTLALQGEALSRGERFRYIGAMNMDVAQLLVQSSQRLETGQVVTLIGRDGEAQLSVEELAGRSGTSPYEWLVGLGARVPRIHLQQGKPVGVHTPNSEMVTWDALGSAC